MLQCLLRASDEMWRYENVIVPALKSGKIVFEVAPCTDTHCEGIPVDVHAEIMRRLPTPVSLTVGDDLNKLRWAKDAVECLKSAPLAAP